MFEILICVIIALLFLVVLRLMIYEPVRSSLDGRNYNTVRMFEDKSQREAANLLARINLFNQQFIQFLRKKYVHGGCEAMSEMRGEGGLNSRDRHMKKVVCRILKRYNPKTLSENFSMYNNDTAYTLGKGKQIKFCLRSKKNKKLHDFNTMKFVSVHEVAHLGTKKYKHPQEFWDNFRELIKDAVESGLYRPVDYSLYPREYCGLNLQHNPYYE